MMLTSTCEQPYLQATYDAAAGGVLDAPLASLATDWNKVSITIRGIRDDTVNPDVKLSSILLKAKVMAYSLDVPEFKQWIERELEGYEGEDVEVPDYREAAGTNFGQFSGYGGAWIDKQGIPVSHLPEAVRERYATLQLREGIPAIEITIESLTQNNKFEMRAPRVVTSVALEVVNTDPPDGATGLPRTFIPTVTFNTELDASTVNTQNVRLEVYNTKNQKWAPVTSTPSFYQDTKSIAVIPARSLGSQKEYRVSLSTGIKSSAGEALASPYSWSFTTAP